MTRRIFYLTGSRADFGLMLPTLKAIAARPGLSLQIAVTGMHLSDRFGRTVAEVEASGLDVLACIPVDIDDDSGGGMARSAAQVMLAMSLLMTRERPDVLLVLGDRAEMLAGAMAATCMGIAVAHLCGGERSGTLDEAFRHSISKLAHVHLVSTEGSRQRLIRMGEDPVRIHVVGAPGLEGLAGMATRTRASVADEYQLDPARALAAVLFHPVVQDAAHAGRQTEAVLDAVQAEGYQAVCLLPNADAGNSQIREAILRRCASVAGFHVVTHLPRREYVSLIASADLLIGNSSSGIVEAASFGTPVVNVGDRQYARERNSNVFDAPPLVAAIRSAIRQARRHPRDDTRNIYGDGGTSTRVADVLASLAIDPSLFKKTNTY